jgi:sec-independent protein translocase protein TatA
MAAVRWQNGSLENLIPETISFFRFFPQSYHCVSYSASSKTPYLCRLNTINMNSFIILGFMGLGTTELIVILVVVLLLFGGRKIPEFMKGLGKGIREFKDETKGQGSQSSTPEKKD